MSVKQHGKVFLNGVIVVAPVIVTVYVVVSAAIWLGTTVAALLRRAGWAEPLPGLGIVIALAAIYVVGLLARTWLLRWPLRLAEAIVDRIPLVKSLYSSVRDLLQFLGGTKEESRGKPCVVRSPDGRLVMLGIITQQQPGSFLPADQERVAVYLPMSYQLGGYTAYLPADWVEELEGTSVEELMKLCLTAGVGTPASGGS